MTPNPNEEYVRPTHEEEYTSTREDRAFEALDKKLNGEKSMTRPKDKINEHNAIESPSHYMFFDIEAIDVIRASLTEEEFAGYLKGNSLKYRLRCGKKDDAIQDLGKAEQYEKMWREA